MRLRLARNELSDFKSTEHVERLLQVNGFAARQLRDLFEELLFEKGLHLLKQLHERQSLRLGKYLAQCVGARTPRAARMIPWHKEC